MEKSGINLLNNIVKTGKLEAEQKNLPHIHDRLSEEQMTVHQQQQNSLRLE